MSAEPRYRWNASVQYRTDTGPVAVEHVMKEVAELHDLVERGPHWDTIESIVVTRIGFTNAPDLTIEQAKRLPH